MGTGRGFNQSQVNKGYFPAADFVSAEEAVDLAEQARNEQAELEAHNHSWYMAWGWHMMGEYMTGPHAAFLDYCRENGR